MTRTHVPGAKKSESKPRVVRPPWIVTLEDGTELVVIATRWEIARWAA